MRIEHEDVNCSFGHGPLERAQFPFSTGFNRTNALENLVGFREAWFVVADHALSVCN